MSALASIVKLVELRQPAETRDINDYRRLIVLGWVVIIALISGFFTWSWFAPLNAAAIAQGTVVVNSSRKSVQHLEGGIIKSILVHDGDQVVTGQPLLTLDDTQAQAKLKLLQARYDSARAEQARLLAERDGLNSVQFPDDLVQKASTDSETGATLAGQRKLFDARQKMMAGQTSILQNRIEQSEQQIVGLRTQEAAKQRQNSLFKQELSGLETLNKKGYAPTNKILAFQRDVAELDAQHGTISSNIAGVQQAIGEARLQMVQVEKTFRENVESSLRDNLTQVFDLAQQVLAARDQVSRLVVRAPVSGTVVDATVHTLGGVIPPGDRLMDIVPEDDKLVVEARLMPNDIDGVRPGQEAEVRFTAFNRYTIPPVHGTVQRVSADRLLDQRTAQPYYLVRIQTADNDMAKLDALKIVPGMPAEVIIDKGPRTFVEYLLGPVGTVLTQAMRE